MTVIQIVYRLLFIIYLVQGVHVIIIMIFIAISLHTYTRTQWLEFVLSILSPTRRRLSSINCSGAGQGLGMCDLSKATPGSRRRRG